MALRTGYGTGTYSAGLYSRPQVFEGAASTTITCGTSSSAQRIHIGSASSSISASASVAGIRIQSGAASAVITSSASAIGYTTIVGAVSDTVQVSTSVGARYKWIDAQEPTTTWTPADYLERAA